MHRNHRAAPMGRGHEARAARGVGDRREAAVEISGQLACAAPQEQRVRVGMLVR